MSAVLFVGDDPSDRAHVLASLGGSGLTVYEVANCEEALERAGQVRPHLVILDACRPGIDVGSACRSLRADAEAGCLPILVLIDGDDADEAVAGLVAGADDCVTRASAGEVVRQRALRLIHARQLAHVVALNEHFVQLGRLLAGIVHEIRGPLAVIRGSAELVMAQLAVEDPIRQGIEPINRNAQLLQARLEHLMSGVRGKPAAPGELEVHPLIREAADLFLKGNNPWGGRVTIEIDVDERLPAVRADAGRLIQVLLSLFGNASEAIRTARGDGHIRVRARGRSGEDDVHDWVVVDVADDGPGILPEHLPRVFEPFFTTKPGGSGFGLYLASEIIKEQAGRLTVANSPEGGACFSLWLAAAVPSAADPRVEAPGPGGAGLG